jgi:hypothetical protein
VRRVNDNQHMLNYSESEHVRICRERATDCRNRADAAIDADARAFWSQQEARWLRLAYSEDISARISGFLDTGGESTFSSGTEEGIAVLLDVFRRVCVALDVDQSDPAAPRKIAHTIIMAALDGEDDPEALYRLALQAASH